MKITIENYFDRFKEFTDFINSAGSLLAAHDFVVRATNGGKTLDAYNSSESVKKTINLYLSKLNEFVNSNKKTAPKQRKIKQAETSKQKVVQDASNTSHKKKNSPKVPAGDDHTPAMVERMPEELRFIKRFINLNGKSKSKEDILRFINSLQKAILEKRIRKTSAYADQIKYIQGKLVEVYNSMKAKITIQLKPETYEQLKKLTGEEKVMTSVTFIKNYINLNGKTGMKKKADQLLKRITRIVDKKSIPSNDPYMNELITITKNLESFLDSPSQKTLAIEKNELNGLEGILGCACQHLNGFDGKPAVMNSMDFANMQFATIGLKGKWFTLIGDPSRNFTAMVFGKPKMGKSYLCIDFAGYLARHHGKVLYVAKEEGLDYTLQQKLNDKDVAHPNLFVASILPDSVASYDFVFLDSVNRLGLGPEDLNRLKQLNPTKSFIFIFQSTKDGKFRGANSFQHDVDVVIEVPEIGKAVQMGRFNQGGEINIFEQAIAA